MSTSFLRTKHDDGHDTIPTFNHRNVAFSLLRDDDDDDDNDNDDIAVENKNQAIMLNHSKNDNGKPIPTYPIEKDMSNLNSVVDGSTSTIIPTTSVGMESTYEINKKQATVWINELEQIRDMMIWDRVENTFNQDRLCMISMFDE